MQSTTVYAAEVAGRRVPYNTWNGNGWSTGYPGSYGWTNGVVAGQAVVCHSQGSVQNGAIVCYRVGGISTMPVPTPYYPGGATTLPYYPPGAGY